jgi:hypothetical protein
MRTSRNSSQPKFDLQNVSINQIEESNSLNQSRSESVEQELLSMSNESTEQFFANQKFNKKSSLRQSISECKFTFNSSL